MSAWTCPACQHAVRHSDAETMPRPGVTYRCPICRLELIVDTLRGAMTLASPSPRDVEDAHKTKRRAANTKAGTASDRGRAMRRSGAVRKTRTHFQQIPVKIVKKVAEDAVSTKKAPVQAK
jgi:hypothetical protein